MANNPFIKIILYPNFAAGHFLQWEIDPLFPDPVPHNFIVEVAGTFDFSELFYTLEVGNNFFAKDKPRAQQTISNLFYYRVKLVTEVGSYYSKTITSEYTVTDRKHYMIASEIARKELLRLRKFSGVTAVVLKRKTYGTLVNDNSVDPVTGLALTDGVKNHGNTFVSGYYKPLETLFSYEGGQDVKRLDPSGQGTLENTSADIRMSGFPLIHYNDILIDKDADLRYIVKDRQEVLYPGTSIIILQKLRLSLIPPSDPVYSIELSNG